MNRKLFLMILITLSLFSCKKEEDETTNGNKWLNEYRVVKITGKNAQWGDFVLQFHYNTKNKLDSAFRYDLEGRRRGYISSGLESGIVSYNIYDFVNAIDADSVKRLDTRLREKYGENYSLIDSIPLVARRLLNVKVVFNRGLLESQEIAYYKPLANVGVGKTFDNNYYLTKKERMIYEYNEDEDIVNVRSFEDVYPVYKLPTYYIRETHKSEYLFDGRVVVGKNEYLLDADSESSWSLITAKKYEYTGTNIAKISGENYEMQLSYSGNSLSSVDLNGKITTYSINDKNLVTKIDHSVDDFMTIEYEHGHGDVMFLTKLDVEQEGFPKIK